VFDGTGLRANPGGRTYLTNNIGLNNAYGAYGQIDWQFAPTWKATVGLRYSYDQKHITEQDNLTCYLICSTQTIAGLGDVNLGPMVDITSTIFNGVAYDSNHNPIPQAGVIGGTAANNYSGVTHNSATGVSTRVLGDHWDAVTGTAGLEWTPFDGTLAFAKYSRGYKAGGFNAANMAPRPETKPESIDAFELGLKQQFRSWGLTTNIDGFFYNYKDVQTPLRVVPPLPAPSYTAFVNIPEVHTWGIELENTWSPIDNLNIMLTYAYLNTEVADGGGQYQNSLKGAGESIDGNELPQSPQNKVALNVNYTWEFADGATLIPSASWYWRDKFTTDIFNDPRTYSPDYDQTDLRLTWNTGGGHFTWIAFARNAFDQTGYEAVSASLRTSSLPESTAGQVYQTFTLTPPRTYGVEFQYHFK
jgi:iron complex outermembrane receptor protein